MDSSKFFITGANGQLGRALKAIYSDAQGADIDALDITDAAAVNNFDWSDIKIIFNAAAFTNVDGAETPEGRLAAWQVNALATANLVRVALAHGITLVHISTDYVFDGRRDWHTEDEPYSPLGIYAQTKAAGDISAGLAPKHYLLRTSSVVGQGRNFVRTMVGLAEKNVSPTVVNDQIGRLTFASELARAVDHLLSIKAPFGTYNVTNSGDPASWADITRAIFKLLGRNDLTVTNATTAEYAAGKPDVAARPLHSTLSLNKLEATGFMPIDWSKALADYLAKEATA